MKIIFICGSLEPGKDGVGDYTRRLCSALLKQGVQVGMLAYNDKYISNKLEDFQWSEGYEIPCIRLPHTWKSKARCKEAKNWIDLHNPEWLSLQFVSYAFHKKGLPFSLGTQLKNIGADRKWHIMFHELWIGMETGSSRKDVLIGSLQKRIIKKLDKKISPRSIHTQTTLYQAQLNKLGINSELLPLFSNIPIFNNNAEFEDIFTKKEIGLEVELVLFGSIHPDAPIEEFANEVSRHYDKNRNDIKKILTLIGRSGLEKQKWKKIFEANNFIINDLGEQNEVVISKTLRKATIGVTTTPICLADKSGTIISMKEHNLPIISVSKKWRPKNELPIGFTEGVIEYEKGNFYKILELQSINSNKHNINEVSKRFIDSLFS